MADIVTRAGKGSPLTNAELDANFTNLNTQVIASVAGPAASTDNALVRYDGVTGKLVQDSLAILADGGTLQIQGVLAGVQIFPRDATGSAFQLYNPTGDDIRFNIGPSDVALLSTGGQLTLVGATNALALASRSGSGASWNFFNPTGANLQLHNGTISNAIFFPTGQLQMAGSAPGLQLTSSSSSTTNQTLFYFTPSNFGAGVPGFLISKTPTSDLYQIGTWDGAGSPGTIQFAVSTVLVNGALSVMGAPTFTGTAAGASINKLTLVNTSSTANSGVSQSFQPGNNATRAAEIEAVNNGANAVDLKFKTSNGDVPTTGLTIQANRDVVAARNLIATEDILFRANGGVPGVVDRAEPRGRYYNLNQPSGVAYTLALTDQGLLVFPTSATAMVVTIPTNAAVAFPVGTRIDFTQWGAGQVSFAPAGGVFLSSVGGKRKLTAQFSTATLIQMAANNWLLTGDLAL